MGRQGIEQLSRFRPERNQDLIPIVHQLGNCPRLPVDLHLVGRREQRRDDHDVACEPFRLGSNRTREPGHQLRSVLRRRAREIKRESPRTPSLRQPTELLDKHLRAVPRLAAHDDQVIAAEISQEHTWERLARSAHSLKRRCWRQLLLKHVNPWAHSLLESLDLSILQAGNYHLQSDSAVRKR